MNKKIGELYEELGKLREILYKEREKNKNIFMTFELINYLVNDDVLELEPIKDRVSNNTYDYCEEPYIMTIKFPHKMIIRNNDLINYIKEKMEEKENAKNANKNKE